MCAKINQIIKVFRLFDFPKIKLYTQGGGAHGRSKGWNMKCHIVNIVIKNKDPLNPITPGVPDQRLLPGGVFRTPKLFSANLDLFWDSRKHY